MQTELPLFEKPLINEAPKPVRNGGMAQYIKDTLRSRTRNEAPYNPSRTRKRLLSLLKHDEWTGFVRLPGKVGQNAEQTAHVLDFLVEKGRIETTELYYLPQGSLFTDRTVHPGYEGNYRGYEEGYRLKNKNCSPL